MPLKTKGPSKVRPWRGLLFSSGLADGAPRSAPLNRRTRLSKSWQECRGLFRSLSVGQRARALAGARVRLIIGVAKCDLIADGNDIEAFRQFAIASEMVSQDLQLHARPDVITRDYGIQQCACCLQWIDLWRGPTSGRPDDV